MYGLLKIKRNIEGTSPLKKYLKFGCLFRLEIIGQHLPINCSKIGHSYEASSFVFSQQKFFLGSFKIGKLFGNFGLIRDSTNRFHTSSEKMILFSRITDESEIFRDC